MSKTRWLLPLTSSSNQSMQVDAENQPKRSKPEPWPERNLTPDISSLSFADHIRILHPIYSLRPIEELSEHKIYGVILSIQEVNQARELRVSIASQPRALLAFMHGLLDITSQQLWMWQMIDQEPNWDKFVHFLVRRSHTIDPAELPRQAPVMHQPRAIMQLPREPSPVPSTSGASSVEQCLKCRGHQHPLIRCPQFRAMSVGDRLWFVGEYELCENCLNLHHPTSKCPKGPCPKCGHKHNSLLMCPPGASSGK